MDRNTPVVMPGYFLECMKIRKLLGISNGYILKNTGWDMARYENNPEPLSINQLSRILYFFYEELKMPYLGLSTGNQWRISCHGLAGVSAMAQQTYGECLEAATRLCDTAFPALAMELIETESTLTLRITELISLAPFSHFYHEAILVNFYNIFHFLLGDEVEPTYISFNYEEPSYSRVHRRYFRCKVNFSSDFTEFAVSKKLASRELLLADRGTAEMAEHTFVKSVPTMNLDCLPKKLRLLLIQSMGAFPSLESAAREIGVSGRTLRRKLHEAGTNYQTEIEQLRQEFAINYLTKSSLPMTDIAMRLGYYDSSAFSRAFKGWTGFSPREYKKRHGNSLNISLNAPVDEPTLKEAERIGFVPI